VTVLDSAELAPGPPGGDIRHQQFGQFDRPSPFQVPGMTATALGANLRDVFVSRG